MLGRRLVRRGRIDRLRQIGPWALGLTLPRLPAESAELAKPVNLRFSWGAPLTCRTIALEGIPGHSARRHSRTSPTSAAVVPFRRWPAASRNCARRCNEARIRAVQLLHASSLFFMRRKPLNLPGQVFSVTCILCLSRARVRTCSNTLVQRSSFAILRRWHPGYRLVANGRSRQALALLVAGGGLSCKTIGVAEVWMLAHNSIAISYPALSPQTLRCTASLPRRSCSAPGCLLRPRS
jgi:hypothetical protein